MSNKPVRFWYNFFKHLTIPLHDTFCSYFHSLVKTSSNHNKILEKGKSIEKNYSNNLKKKTLKLYDIDLKRSERSKRRIYDEK